MYPIHRNVVGLVLSGLMLVAVSPAFAQRDAGAKIRGDFGRGYWANRSTSRHLERATDASKELHEYSRAVPQVEPAIAQPDAELVGHNIVAAKKSLAVVKESAADNKEILKRISAIEEHLAAADKHFAQMHGECCKADADNAVVLSCCNDLIKELEKARSEHDALLRTIQPSADQPAINNHKTK